MGHKDGAELEVLMLEQDNGEWWFRRNPLIRMAVSQAIIRGRSGFQVLNPAIVLLFKSNRMDEKDEHDLDMLLPVLGEDDREWLKNSLSTMEPKHRWLQRL